jgi:hypothetical protein
MPPEQLGLSGFRGRRRWHHDLMTDASGLRDLCRDFITEAFDVLRSEHVIPTPVYHPFIAVGRDYFGDSIGSTATFNRLESKLNEQYPDRFGNPSGRRDPDFASIYIYSFLEACVARCSRERDYSADCDAVGTSFEELARVLESSEYTVVCARHVTHLTTGDGEIKIGEVTIVPEPEGFGGVLRRIQREIPGAARAWNREEPTMYDPPHALLLTRETADDADPYAVARRTSGQLDRFLLLARLLTAGTVQSAHEDSGLTTLIGRMDPLSMPSPKGMLDTPVRRTVHLTGAEEPAFAALGQLLDAAEVKREGMLVTSFDVAIRNFNLSHSSEQLADQLVDLATALEAVLIGGTKETEGLTLRLKNRAAALLATEDDPARTIFADVNELYSLRSKLVHGGQISDKELRKLLKKVSNVSPELADTGAWIAFGHAVDRMRDLVRRAILARLCLAAGPEPLWPFSGDTPVDAVMTDNNQRTQWRDAWRQYLTDLGVGHTADKPRPASNYLTRDDQ